MTSYIPLEPDLYEPAEPARAANHSVGEWEPNVGIDMSPYAWMREALCRGLPISLFFPPKAGKPNPVARHICNACPVRETCLDWALTHNEIGMWGGMDHRERDRYKRAQRARARRAQGRT